MINAWSLLYDEIYGDDEMSPCKTNHNDDDIVITTVGSGNTASATTFNIDAPPVENITIDTSNFDDDGLDFDGGNVITDFDDITFYDDTWPHASLATPIEYGELPTPGIESKSTRKYKEDESIEALKNYISTTYGGHYTSDNNSVQTLDLIESVGDAESFCRSNAIKYLSRYDKKGQAKRDILKALHYSLLLYHFSGQLNETTTRGYETF